MSVWGVTMVKDEADVIEGVLRHMAGEGLDGIIVADNGSTDGTRNILDDLWLDLDLPGGFVVIEDDEVAYYQSRKMTALAERAHAEYGATWIVPFDADELWLAPDRLSVILGDLRTRIKGVRVPLHNHYATGLDECGVRDPFQRMRWRDPNPLPLPKIAIRWKTGTVIHAGNHGADIPGAGVIEEVGLQVRHFPYRSPSQFVRKARNGAAAYAATGADLNPGIGAHWREYGALLERDGAEALADIYWKHFFKKYPVEEGLIEDPAPYRRWE